MAHLLSSERPAMAAAPISLMRALAAWFVKARNRRAQRLVLVSLLDYDQDQLEDIGINRQDLFEALDAPSQRPGLKLAQKRAERARLWLDL